MIKVECESCKANYELDERRIPPGGMKMRCPKCGTSFDVSAGGAEQQPAAPPNGAGQEQSAAAPSSISDRTKRVKQTLIGSPETPAATAPIPAGISSGKKLGGTVMGIGANVKPGPAPVADTPATPGAVTDGAVADTELPAPAAKAGRGGTLLSAAAPPVEPAKGARPRQIALKPMDQVEETDAVLAELPSPAAAKAPVPPAGAPRGQGYRGPQQPGPAAPAPLPPSADDVPDFSGLMDEADSGQPEKTGAAKAYDPELSFADLALPDLPVSKAEKRTATTIGTPATPPLARSGDEEASFADLSLTDLPAPKTSEDLPKTKKNDEEASFADVSLPDLPAPGPRGVGDLPRAKKSDEEASFADVSLPDLPAPSPREVSDLPRAKKSDEEASFADVSLPDLPAPKGVSDLPAPKREGDLPAVKRDGDQAGFTDLSLPDLPAPRGSAAAGDLPLPKQIEEGFGELELPLPKTDSNLSAPKHGTVQGLGGAPPLPPPPPAAGAGTPPPPPGSTTAAALPTSLLSQEAEAVRMAFDASPEEAANYSSHTEPAQPPPLPEPPGGEANDFVSESMHERKEPFDSLGRSGLGSASFGEVDLGQGGGGEDEAEDDEMEFGMQGAALLDDEESELDEDAMALPPDILRRQRGAEFEAKQQAAMRRSLMLVVKIAVALALIAVAGLGMGMTEHGIFGIYFFEQYLPSASSDEFARDAIADSEKTAADDTYRGSRMALKKLDVARRDRGLNRLLLTRSLMHQSFFLVRFGQHTTNASRAAAIYKRLEERSFVALGMEIAFAADALRKGELDRAAGQLARARAKAPKDPYVHLISGELALRRGKFDEAEKAFQIALTLGGGARAQWGLARVLLNRDDRDAQIAAIEETLKMSPLHIDARIAKAHILVERSEERQALTLLREAVGLSPVDNEYLWSYKSAKAQGYSIIGYLHETRGRLHLARKAYDMALAADPYRMEALLGAGGVSLREHRFNDALARFESALNTAKVNDPKVFTGRKASTEATFGISRAYFELGRQPEAREKLHLLSQSLPEDSEILLWLGKTENKLQRREVAESLYRKAIGIKPNDFEGYLALAQLYFDQGKTEEAIAVLRDAASNVPESAPMHRLRGESELKSKRLDTAIHHFKRALELDPEDLEARFMMANAFRKNGQLHEAKLTLDQVASRDAAFAGLDIEWGLYYEAQGAYGKAVDKYRGALEKDPESTELLLRLGAAQVENGEIEAAGATLRDVIRRIPNSAEAEYFIGRIDMAKHRTPDALTHFDRAIALDPGRAEFHIWAGKAALEMKNIGRVNEEAQKAIDIDASTGEAYLLRGLIRMRAGIVKNALRDFNRALKLKPSLSAAYAYMGECYDQLRRLDEAVRSYRKALERESGNGEWWFKLGRLLFNPGRVSEAGKALRNAVRIGDEAEEPPYWLAEAHRSLGEILAMKNNRRAAIVHYQRFLELAPEGSIDRRTVKKALKEWGIDVDAKEEMF